MRVLLILLACCIGVPSMSGCKDSKNTPAKPGDAVKKEEHSHGEGPHGGALTDWGGGAYHVEFAPVHETKEVTVYILGGDVKTAAPLKMDKIKLVINEPKTEMELVAKPLDGEKDGKSSRFVGKHDTIGIVREFAGTISGQAEGTPYTGDFKEEPHVDKK